MALACGENVCAAVCALQCACCSVCAAVCALQCVCCSVCAAVCVLQCVRCSVRAAVCVLQCACCSVCAAVCVLQCVCCSVRAAVCMCAAVCVLQCVLQCEITPYSACCDSNHHVKLWPTHINGTYVPMCVPMYVPMYVCAYVRTYVCFTCMYVCVFQISTHVLYVRMCVSNIHTCTVCTYVCTHVGVGNVCSYAEMSIRRHGDPRWNTFGPGGGGEGSSVPRPSAAEQGEMGKTEMSLLQFKVRTALQTQQTLHSVHRHSILRNHTSIDTYIRTYVRI